MSLLLLADQEPAPEGESPATAGGRSSAGLAVPKTLDEKLEDAGFNRNPWLTHGEKAMLIAEDEIEGGGTTGGATVEFNATGFFR